jgi:PTS system nitrogen regulatory IIA component
MAQVHGLRKTWVTASLTRREMAGSTALGHGFAIPHARVAGLDRSIGAYLRLKSPIPFGAPDRQPVADVLVLLVPAPAVDEHLGILADATRLFGDADFRLRLHRQDDPLQIRRLFVEWPDRAA